MSQLPTKNEAGPARTDGFARPREEDVAHLAKRGAKWAVFLTIGRQVLSIGTTMIVSRFVTPADVGTIGMVLSLIAFVILVDTGMSWATVQSKDLDKSKIDQLFWFGVAIGAGLWGVCAAAGPFLAVFYKNNELYYLCAVVGVAPFLNSLATQPAALMKRQIRQKEVNLIESTALAASSISAMLLALVGMGIWALVAQVVLVYLVRAPFYFFKSGYYPGPMRGLSSALPIFRKGMGLAISNFVCYFQLYLGGIVVGRLFGAKDLGYYLRAYGLKSLPTSYATMIVTDVMVSSLAALRDNPDQMRAAYSKALRLTAFVGCPAGALLWPMAPEAVQLLYGSQWEGAVPLVRIFSVAAVALPISTSTIWLFLAMGNVRAQLKMNVLLTALIVVGYWAAIKMGRSLEFYVAFEALMYAFPFTFLNLYVSHRICGISLSGTLRVLSPILGVSFFVAALLTYMSPFFEGRGWMFALLSKAVSGLGLYILVAFLIIRPFPFQIRLRSRLG